MIKMMLIIRMILAFLAGYAIGSWFWKKVSPKLKKLLENYNLRDM